MSESPFLGKEGFLGLLVLLPEDTHLPFGADRKVNPLLRQVLMLGSLYNHPGQSILYGSGMHSATEYLAS
jgi:hypothetical protein